MKPITASSLMLAAALTAGGPLAFALPTVAQAQIGISVQIGTPPPPPRYEVVPAPRPGYVWAAGHYEWLHGNYIWRRGHWVRARPGYAYVPAAWRAQGGRWVYQPPRWDARPVRVVQPSRGQGAYRGDYRRRTHARPGWLRDNDRDGVPNRYDRSPNDPRRY